MNALLTDRTPPHNVDAERALLGGIFRDPHTLHDVRAVVTAEAFYTDANQRIFRAMEIVGPSRLDLVSVYTATGKTPEVTPAYLADLWDTVPTGANVGYHAATVRDCATRRNLIHAVNEIIRDCYDHVSSADEMLAAAERKIHAVAMASANTSTDAHHIGPIMRRVMEDIATRIACGGTMTGLPTGYPDLDAMLGGLRPGELVVIGARPSVGKTALALNVLANLANFGVPTLLASLEMREEELAERLLAMGSGVSMHRLNRPRELTGREIEELTQAASTAGHGGAPLFVDDASDQPAARIASVARRTIRQHGVQILAVDYLQLMRPENPRDNRTQQVGTLAMRMKQLARELNIPILLLSQLNRESEAAGGRKPKLSDLRESGDIEAHADKVCLLHREEMVPENPVWTIDVIVAKNRNGPIGDVRLAYRRPILRFENSRVM